MPTTPEDVAALAAVRALRPHIDWEHLAPTWPPPPDVGRRPTAEGRLPFEL